MKTPNERIESLEQDFATIKSDLALLSHMMPWAIHKALEGLMDSKKINYTEKRIIWEAVSKEISEGLATTAFLGDNIHSQLARIDQYSRTRR